MAGQSFADRRGNLGRYALYGEIAAGGMATVHLARLLGSVGFARTVAIKRLHPAFAHDPEFVSALLNEARLAARIRHPNVVSTLDVVSEDGELFLVMEYVAGESLSRLVRKTREAGKRVPVRYVVGIMAGALEGLHAAHEAKSERNVALGIVHRDVSPQNIHVGTDGVTRVLDFGIAKATNRVQDTRTDQIKGKIAYMSGEQLAKAPVDRRADIYSASVVLWEALTGHRLFTADDVPALVYAIVNEEVLPPSTLVPDLPAGLDAIVMRGLDRDPTKRWSTAREIAAALEAVVAPAPAREIGHWVEQAAGEALAARQDLVHSIESATTSTGMTAALRIDSPSRPLEVASGIVKTDSVIAAEERAPAPTGRATLATLVEGAVARATAPAEGESVPKLEYEDDGAADDERETLVAAGAKAALADAGLLPKPAESAPELAPHARAPYAWLVPVLAGAIVVVLTFLVVAIATTESETEPATPAALAPTAPAAAPAPSASAAEGSVLLTPHAVTSASAKPQASAPPPPTSMLAPITRPRASASATPAGAAPGAKKH